MPSPITVEGCVMKIRSAPSFKPIALAVALALAAPHAVLAGPAGATVVSGQVQITQPNSQTTVVRQGSDKAIVNWTSFSIGAGESVQFQQPNANSVALNRVTSAAAPSEIYGSLSANGKVFLINPAGIVFGRTASVDVGSLVASTLNIRDDDFLAGRYVFTDGGGAGAVRNQGSLSAAERGTIALLGAQVNNEGTITARLGTVGLAAGGKVSLDFSGDGLTRIVVDAGLINALVNNGGAVLSEGGQVTMTARALGALADTVVKNSGVVRARSLVERDGRIVLDGGDSKVEVAGTLDASGLATGQHGGAVTVLGKDIVLAHGGEIDARGDAGGGTVLVGGAERGAGPALPRAASTTMEAGSAIHADALGAGDGGTIVLWSDGALRAGGSLSARGGAQSGNGGLIETSGHSIDIAGLAADASAARGKAGTWLLDPGDFEIDATQAAIIASVLNTGTDSITDSTGSITVSSSILKSAGTDATLTLKAARDIIMYGGPTIRSTSGRLHVNFNANSAGRVNPDVVAQETGGVGAIVLDYGSTIATNGGDIRFYGQDDVLNGRAIGHDGRAAGIRLDHATLDTRVNGGPIGGSIVMRASGANAADTPFFSGGTGIEVVTSTLRSGSGDIRLDGHGGMGRISVSEGTERGSSGAGIDLDLEYGGDIETTSGAISILGSDGGDRASTDPDSLGLHAAGSIGLNVHLGTGRSIRSDAGNIELHGISNGMPDPEYSGTTGAYLFVSGGSIESASGSIAIIGENGAQRTSVDDSLASSHPSESTGLHVSLYDGSISAPGGSIRLQGENRRLVGFEAGESNGTYLYMYQSSLTAGGAISVTGSDGAITAVSGGPAALDPEFFAESTGLSISVQDGSQIRTASGDIELRGTTYGTGNPLLSSALGTDLTMYGGKIGSGGRLGIIGIALDDGIDGLAIDGSFFSTTAALSAGAGGIFLAGRGVSGTGLSLWNTSATTTSGGTISVAGESASGTGALITGVTLGDPDMTGNVVIRAGSGDTSSAMLSFGEGDPSSIRTSGVVTLLPGGVDANGSPTTYADTTINVGAYGAGDFNIAFPQLGIGGSGASRVVIGSAEHKGLIRFNDPMPFAGDLTLQNDGAGSAGIELYSDINVAGQLTLSSGGTVAAGSIITYGGPITTAASRLLPLASLEYGGPVITATSLLLHGARPESNFQLAFPGNRVSLFSATFDTPKSTQSSDHGDVNFTNTGALTVGNLSGTGFSTASNAATVINAAETVVAGDLVLNTSGDLTLTHNVSTLGGDITLVTGGVFLNPNNSLLTAGGGNWRVFADTWIGEVRGNLAPTQPRPNYYGCTWDSDCSAGIAGKHFFYRAQPQLTIRADAATREYGDADPLLSYSGSGLVNGDSLLDAALGGYASAAPLTASVGSYATNGSFTSPVGYQIVALPGTLAVTPATLLVGVDNKGKVYGAADPALTVSLSGFKLGDTAAVVSGLTLSTAAGAAATAGTHAIVGANASAANYRFVYQPGVLTVAKAPLQVIVDNKSKTYGDLDPALSASFSGFQYNDTAAVVDGLNLSTVTGAAATAGTHAITGSNASAANYTIAYQPGTLTVARAPLTIRADNKSKTYGDLDPALSASYSGLRYGDTAAVVDGLTLSTATGAAATAGTHAITGSNASAANYTIAYQSGTLTVARAPLTITADNKSKVYGAADPALTATMSGFRYGDTGSVVSGLTLNTATGAVAGAGTHPIVASNASAANYAITFVPGVLSVDQAVLSYIATPATQFQSTPGHPLGGTVTGFVYNDTAANATTGALTFTSSVTPLSAPGTYAVQGSGLSSANYRFVQAESNGTALTVLPTPAELRPTVIRDVTFESSNVYEKNFGTPRLCVGTGPLDTGSMGVDGNDVLAVEWSRVRVSPNLSNCLGLGQRNSCSDF
jgi:filamentous hemagglutinin family protein